MARPRKTGLDYFPLDTDILSDRKLNAPRRRFGTLAIVVYLQLLCLLYRDKGYYIEFSEETREDVILSILAVLIGQQQPDYETVQQVIDALVTARLFDRERYGKGFLTSRRAQQVYYSATIERRAVHVDPALWLLDIREMRELSGKHSLLQSLETPADNGESPADNPQSKEKQSTLQQSTAQDSRGSDDDRTQIYWKFQELFGRAPQADFAAEAMVQGRPLGTVLDCMGIAAHKGADRPEPYILAVLRKSPLPDPAPPDGTLPEWEKLWLQDVAERRRKRQNDGSGTA